MMLGVKEEMEDIHRLHSQNLKAGIWNIRLPSR